MVRAAGEAPSGGASGEKIKQRELSDEMRKRFAKRILEISIKYGLSEQDENSLFDLLDSAYGENSGDQGQDSGSQNNGEGQGDQGNGDDKDGQNVGDDKDGQNGGDQGQDSGSQNNGEGQGDQDNGDNKDGQNGGDQGQDSGSQNNGEGQGDQDNGDNKDGQNVGDDKDSQNVGDNKDGQNVGDQGQDSGSQNNGEGQGDQGNGDNKDGQNVGDDKDGQNGGEKDGQNGGDSKDNDGNGENGENAPDYSPLTYGEAKKSGDSSISPVSKESIKKKHPELSDQDINITISFVSAWNRISHEDRLRILKNGAIKDLEGMVDSLLAAGLIEIGGSDEPNDENSEDGKDEDGENGEDDDNEEGGENGEDGERDKKAGEFVDDKDKSFWLEVVKNIDPIDLLDKPDDYSIDVINGLEEEYESDCEKLADELMDNNEFGDWYESQGGNVSDLADMGFKALYELRQQFEKSKEPSEEPQEKNEGDLIAVGLNSDDEITRRAREIAKEKVEADINSQKGVFGFLKKIWLTQTKILRQDRMQGEIRKKIIEKNNLLIKKESGTISADEERKLKELQDELGADSWTASEGDTERFVLAHVSNMREAVMGAKGESMFVYGVEYVETNEDELNEDGTVKLDANGNPIKKRIPKAYRMDKDQQGNVNKQEVTGEAAEFAIAIEGAIRAYASAVGNIERDANLTADQKRDKQNAELEDFRRKMDELRRKDIQNGGDGTMINNYEAVAQRAAERAKHEIGVDAVMDGFRYINGKINREVNTQPHRNAIEKLGHMIGRYPFVPEGAAVMSAWIIMTATKTAGNTLGRAAAGLVGGSVVGAVFNGLKFADDYREQYATAAHALATNAELGDRKFEGKMTENVMRFMTREKEGGGREKITADLLSNDLNKLTAELNAAFEEFNRDPNNDEARAKMLGIATTMSGCILDARNRLLYGAEQQVDLMAFSSNDLGQIEKERLNLWKSIAVAQTAYNKMRSSDRLTDSEVPDDKAIFEKSRANLQGIVKEGESKINSDIRWSTVRNIVGGAIKGLIIGAIADDAIANVSSEKISTLEHLGIVKTQNSDTATNSILSGFLDKVGVPGFKTEDLIKGGVFNTQQEAENYIKQNGGKQSFKKVHNPSKDQMVSGGTQSDAEYCRNNFEEINKRKWWGYGKKESVGNELKLYGKPDSMRIEMNGISTDGLGNSINTEALQKGGKLELLISVSKDSQKYPIHIPFDANGVADYSNVPAEIMERIRAGDIYMAEVAQVAQPGDTVTNIFASMPYYKGGGSIEVKTLKQGFDFVVEEIKGLRDPGVTFNQWSFLATALHAGRGLNIRRNGGRGPSGGDGPEGNPGGGNPEGNPEGGNSPDGNPEGSPDGNPEGGNSPDGSPEGSPDGNPEGSPDGGNEGNEDGEDLDIVPLTAEELSRAGMRRIDVINRMNDMMNKILPTLSSPEDRNELTEAVKRWNDMRPNQWRVFLSRPNDPRSPENKAMMEVLKKHKMVKEG
ncbi:hypothetical protein IJV57_03410 [Candidatus Saccharibacteria bacterium]|nr:hypothetical protein [Candidatus Saccharibacteria bacterium]